MTEEYETPATLIKKAINVHGELHLDRDRTASLLRWMEVQERCVDEMSKNLLEILTALKPVIGVEAFTLLFNQLKEPQ